MVYFDNSATGFFKPSKVIESVIDSLHNPVNISRGGYPLSVECGKKVFLTRQFLSSQLNNNSSDRVIFTHNATEGLNFFIFGLPLKGNIVTTVTEHNSVLRPLYHLQNKGVELRFAKLNEYGYVDQNAVLSLVDKDTSFVIMNGVSNVTGNKNSYEQVGLSLRGTNIPLIVDCAQVGGHSPIDMAKYNIFGVVLAGHKGLYSMQGVGVMAFNNSFDISPTLFGGSGSESFLHEPTTYPDKLESGTLNYPSILSLYYGAQYAYSNMAYSIERLTQLTDRLIDGLKAFENIKIYSNPNQYGIVSFIIKGTSSIDIADILSSTYDISTRGGYHCAPLLHKALNTEDSGLLRVSLSPFNTQIEVDYFIDCIKKMMSE